MAIRFTVPGREAPDLKDAPTGTELFEDEGFHVEIEDAASVALARDAGRVDIEADEDDVLELRYDDGSVFCVPAGVLRDDVEADPRSRSRSSEDGVPIPLELGFGRQSRGLRDWALRAVRRLVVREAADLAARALVERIEGKLDKIGPGPGLHRWLGEAGWGAPVEGELPADPCLVFLHGTASSTTGSFGALAEGGQGAGWGELHARFGDRIFALEHPTLSRSPIENAVEVARHLPKDARLHLVSHSRGGIVGELLCRPGFDDLDRGLFSGAGRQDDLEALRELDELLRGKAPRIERFVRVACPARGTTLASRRLDRYLSLILNAFGLVPGLRLNPVYELMKSLLVAIAKKRADPEDLPGLEAQMPESPLVRLLNRQDLRVEADLSVIAGDIEGAGVWDRLKVLATDLFYREDHDLVVNTSAMTGGGRRPAEREARYAFDHGAGVSHFNYFRNSTTRRKLLAALRSDADREREFRPLPPPGEPLPRGSYQAQRGAAQPVVFVLPGIMGTQLSSRGNRIWVDLDDIALGGMKRLGSGAEAVAVDGLMPEYRALVSYLSDSHEVVAHPFDWRLSVFDAADELAGAVRAKLASTGRPVRFLAHSMGGLVVRALAARHPELWREAMGRGGARFVMLGTPTEGSYAIPHILLGREPVLRKLALVDLTQSRAELIALVGGFPGLFDMLPLDPHADLFDSELWKRFRDVDEERWGVPDEAALARARERRAELREKAPLDRRHTVYVAGQAAETPWGIAVAPGIRRLVLRGTALGDGRVTWASGIPAEVPTWFMPVPHGRLAAHPPAFGALLELLEKGETDRLSRTQPSVRSAEIEFALSEPLVDMYPDREDLVASALGYRPEVELPIVERRLRVSVSLGDLGHARFPVMVGHYEKDGLYSAEASLDGKLGGHLRRLHALGIYPGPIGSSEIVLRPPAAGVAGAVVVGLGEVGKLSPGRLARTITEAMLRYAVAVAEGPGNDGGPTGVSAILIGSTEGGVSLQDAIASILRGVAIANQKIVEAQDETTEPITEVELIELFEDRAVCAAETLRRLGETLPLAPGLGLEVASQVRRLPGFRRRIPCGPAPGWWQRLEISGGTPEPEGDERLRSAEDRPGRDGSLRFVSLTDRARAEDRVQPTQVAFVERLLESATQSTRWSPETAHSLFSLLVPNELKAQAPDDRNLVLVLDREAARFPWELLTDARGGQGKPPIAVRAGMLRQLRTETFRVTPLRSGEKAALVVGDPEGPLVPLPGAREEAREVAALLDDRYRTVPLDRPRPEELIDALFRHEYQVLHLAGHGEYHEGENGGPPRGGLVLADGLLLSPSEIRNMMTVPDLVVVNCCHLGRIDGRTEPLHLQRPVAFAANLAEELIRMGVRAVVAAGWAVDDAAARTFSLELYDRLLRGGTFGDAVRAAREAVHGAHPNVNTWGAYQCYGDPGFRLSPKNGDGEAEARKYVDPCQAVIELGNLAGRAEPGDPAEVRAAVDSILRRLPEGWTKRADVAAGLAAALGGAGAPSDLEAICREALAADEGELPFDLLEHLLEAKVALAAAADAGRRAEARGQLRELLDALRSLVVDLAPAPGRLARLAGAYAGLARVSTGAVIDEALQDARRVLTEVADDDAGAELPQGAERLLRLSEIEILLRERGAPSQPSEIRDRLERVAALVARLDSPSRGATAALEARLALARFVLEGRGFGHWEEEVAARFGSEVSVRAAGALELARSVLADQGDLRGARNTEARKTRRKKLVRSIAGLQAMAPERG